MEEFRGFRPNNYQPSQECCPLLNMFYRLLSVRRRKYNSYIPWLRMFILQSWPALLIGRSCDKHQAGWSIGVQWNRIKRFPFCSRPRRPAHFHFTKDTHISESDFDDLRASVLLLPELATLDLVCCCWSFSSILLYKFGKNNKKLNIIITSYSTIKTINQFAPNK